MKNLNEVVTYENFQKVNTAIINGAKKNPILLAIGLGSTASAAIVIRNKDALVAAIKTAANFIANKAKTGATTLKNAAVALFAAIRTAANFVGNKSKDGAVASYNAVSSLLASVKNKVTGFFVKKEEPKKVEPKKVELSFFQKLSSDVSDKLSSIKNNLVSYFSEEKKVELETPKSNFSKIKEYFYSPKKENKEPLKNNKGAVSWLFEEGKKAMNYAYEQGQNVAEAAHEFCNEMYGQGDTVENNSKSKLKA